MGLFGRKQEKKSAEAVAATSKAGTNSDEPKGVVSQVLTPPSEPGEPPRFGDIVERTYGPRANSSSDSDASGDTNSKDALVYDSAPAFSDAEASDRPTLEIDSMAYIGCSTTITGRIVAEEDLEVYGTVEGTITLEHHQLRVGDGGVVQADVQVNSILVIGRVNGNVSATDFVEVKAGGYIEGNVIAPRIIMADGAIVIGSLDMTAGLPKDLERFEDSTSKPSGAHPSSVDSD